MGTKTEIQKLVLQLAREGKSVVFISSEVEEMLRTYAQRRAYLIQELSKIEGLSFCVPRGAFYMFINISSTGMTAEQFAMDLLEKERVVLVPGEAFGEEGKKYVRLSFATSMQTIQEGVRRLARYMSSRI